MRIDYSCIFRSKHDSEYFVDSIKQGMVTIDELVRVTYAYEILKGSRARLDEHTLRIKTMPMTRVYAIVGEIIRDFEASITNETK